MSGDDVLCLKRSPKLPFVATGRLETDDGITVAGKIRDGCVPFRIIGYSASNIIGEAMKIQPVAADIYADNAAMY